MVRTINLIGLAAAGLMVSACATEDHQTARADEATTLAHAPATQPMALENTGLEALAWGDKYTAANLFERSTDKDDTVAARFNLANAYEHTGRLTEAAELYAGLARDGQFTWLVSSVDYRRPEARLHGFNVAEESARRLARLRRELAFGPANGGAPSAGEFGTPTAAVVGPGQAIQAHRISDAEAMRLDAEATP